jgi:putative transcriptional regulator
MTIRHHLPDELLLAYAAGTLAEPWSLVVATHLSLCPVCRAREAHFAAIGGAELESFMPERLDAGALDACFARIERQDRAGAGATGDGATFSSDTASRGTRADRTLSDEIGSGAAAGFIAPQTPVRRAPRQTPRPAAPPLFPAPLRRYAGGDADAVRWRPIGFGIRQRRLLSQGNTQVRLLLVSPGVALPEHGHRGLELIMVLKGSFDDAHDEFGRGDISVADEQVSHRQVIGSGEPCICLVVTDAPLAFRSIVYRIAQRFVGL